MTKSLQAIKIVGMELTPVYVPFKAEVLKIMQAGSGGFGMALKAEEPWTGGDFVILRLRTDSGHTGLGEAFVWLPETGEVPSNVIKVIEKHAATYVLGACPFDHEQILEHLENNIARNEVAKGLIDMALWDLRGQILRQPLTQLLGRIDTEALPMAGCVPLSSIAAIKEIAGLFVAQGMKTLRFKLGLGVEKDVAIISTMRQTLGPDIRFRVDYNQAYQPEEAIAAIRAIAPFGIDAAEQPVARGSFVGMARVQKAVTVPLMAHEGCFSLDDIETLLALGAIRVVGINSERPGGMTLALRAIELAKKHGLGVIIHNQPLGIASAMMIQLGCSRFHDLHHAVEVLGDVMLEDDLIEQPLSYENGFAHLPKGPGFGVTLDEKALKKYATASTLILSLSA